MNTVIMIAVVVIWLNLGIFSVRAMNELDEATPLEDMFLPLRLLVIITAPVALLVFERHLLYSSRESFK